jgi:hypothetical protein
MRGNVAVAEIDTEQVRVRDGIDLIEAVDISAAD